VKKIIEIGDIQAFIQYTRNFTQPITQLASISNTLQQTIAASERVFEFLDEPEESPDPGFASASAVRGNVSFEHMAFGYDANKLIIHDFSASIHQGEKAAIVGPTGAGKTTIVKLLMRFYDINSGDIKIDGHSIYEYTRNELRSVFGMVLQDTWLYNASILNNIRYGTFDATREQVIAAAKAAHCDEFIRTLPQGYDTILNEESDNISQGQKQLLTIARVILADPKILILDEATSSIDTRTEILIQKAMDALMKGRTSFIIAHRLSTIKNADLILVMDGGDIVEQGNHAELLAAGGFYAGMYNSQFERKAIEHGN
jgi:ATP-binding cassette subfamily B protein